MKILTIFKKNLKTISRSPIYFLVLFIFPLILILIAGSVVGSISIDNLNIGIVNHDPDYQFNLSFKNLYHYNSLSDCLYYLTDEKINICFFIDKKKNGEIIEIYLDNTLKILKYYVKQSILEDFFNKQNIKFQETSKDINSKISVYSNSVIETKRHLEKVKRDLDNQEQMLLLQKENLTKIRKEFNEIYYPLKDSLLKIKRIENNFSSEKETYEKNKKSSQLNILEINLIVNDLNSFLSLKLAPGDYSSVSEDLEKILLDLKALNDSLNSGSSIYDNSNLIDILGNLDEIIEELDHVNEFLDQLDNSLDIAIKKIRQTKTEVQSFIVKLVDIYGDLEDFSRNIDSKKLNIDFKDLYINLSTDPIFFSYPLLVSLIITFSSLVLSNMFILRLVNKKGYLRNIISPTHDFNFVFSNYLINLFFIFIQALILLFIGYYWFDLSLKVILFCFLVIFLTASIFIFVGMSFGYLIRSQSISMLSTIFLLMLLLVLSDLLISPALTSPLIKFFININPFYVLSELLRGIIIIKKSFAELKLLLTILEIFFIILFIVTLISKKFNKEKMKN